MADEPIQTNSLVQLYRKRLEAQGRKDRRTDLEITLELGDTLRANGDYETEDKYPDFKEQYLQIKHNTERGLIGEVGAGVRRGARGLAATAMGAAALGLDLVGADETAKSVARKAIEVQGGGEDNQSTVERMDDIRGIGDAARYVAGKFGEAVPSVTEAIVTGLVGAAIGTAAEPGAGTVAGGAAGILGKQVVKSLIKKGIAKQILKEETEDAVFAALKQGTNQALKKAFADEAKSIAARRGGAALAALNSYALSAGEIYNETESPALALGAGAVAALPDTVLPSYVIRKFFPGAKNVADVAADEVKKVPGFLSRLATEAAKTIPVEAGTEAFQELVNIAAAKYHNGEPMELTSKDYERLREAAAGGAAGGVVAAPVAAAPSGRATPTKTGQPMTAPDAATAARRNISITQQPAAPKREDNPMRAVMAMTPAQQDARFEALGRLTKRTASEEQELELLRATISQRPTEDKTPALAPVKAEAPAAPTEAPPAPVAPVAPAAPTPLVSQPVAAPAQPPKPATTPRELASRIRAAGRRLSGIVNDAPTVDAAPAYTLLEQISAQDTVTEEGVASLEATIDTLANAAVTEAARIAAETAKQKQAREQKRADVRNAKAEAEALRAQRQLDRLAKKAAKQITPEPTSQEPTPAPAEQPAQAEDNLREQLDKALNPQPAETPAPSPAEPFSFGSVTLASSDFRPAMNELTPAAARRVDWEKTIDVSGSFDDKGNRSNTRIAVAFLTPDSKVLLRGVTNYNLKKGLRRIGDREAGTSTGPAIQGMGSLKGKTKDSKVINPAGKEQVLVNDLVDAGYIPIARLNFTAEPGFISQDFDSVEAFDNAWGATEKVSAQTTAVTESQGSSSLPSHTFATGDAAIAAAEAANAGAAPIAAVTEGGDVIQPTVTRDAVNTEEESRFEEQKANPKVKVARITQKFRDSVAKALGKKRLGNLLKSVQGLEVKERSRIIDNEIESNAKLTKLGDSGLVAAAIHKIVRDISAAAAPVESSVSSKGRRTRDSGDGRRKLSGAKRRTGITRPLPNTGRVVPAFFERLHGVIESNGGKFDADTVSTISSGSRDKLLKLYEITELDWDTFASTIQAGFDAANGNAQDFAALMKGQARERRDNIPALANEQIRFTQLLNRLRSHGFDIELIQSETMRQDASMIGGRIVLAMEDVTNANLTNLVSLIHEVGHVLIANLDQASRERLSAAVDRAITEARDGKLVSAARNANLDWEERLVETIAIKLSEEGFDSGAPSLARLIWNTVRDLYYRVAAVMMKAMGRTPTDAMVMRWFENQMRRTLGDTFDRRFTDLFRPFVETKAERVQRFSPIGGALVPDFYDPIGGTFTQPEVLPDTAEAALWNLHRHRLVKGEGYYKGKRLSDIIGDVRPEEPGSKPGNPNAPLGENESALLIHLTENTGMTAADGRRIDMLAGDSETVRMMGIDPRNATEQQLARARARHLLTDGHSGRSVQRPEKAFGAPLIAETLGKADLVLESQSGDRRTPDQKNYVYVKLYKVSQGPVWHFVRVDHAGRLISQHAVTNQYGTITKNEGAGVVKSETGTREIQSGTNQTAPARPQVRPQRGDGSGIAELEVNRPNAYAATAINKPTGWSQRKLKAAVMQSFADELLSFEEMNGALAWIDAASEEQRKILWTEAGGGKLRDDTLGEAQGYDYTEAMARIQSAAWNELTPVLAEIHAEVGNDKLTLEQIWKMFSRGDIPPTILQAIESQVPGASSAVIGGEGMTEAMNERANYQAYRIVRLLERVARRRTASKADLADRAATTLTDAAKQLNKIEREYRDADMHNAMFNERLLGFIREAARDMDRGVEAAFASGKLTAAIREIENLTEDQAIPERYQRVFKSILDSNGVSIFNEMSALAQLNLPLAKMSVREIVEAIQSNAPTSQALKTLSENRPLMVALASLAKNNTRDMDLLQLRVLKDSAELVAIKAELDEIRVASDERLEELAKTLKESRNVQGLRDRLRYEYVEARRKFRAKQRVLRRAEESIRVTEVAAEKLATKAEELARVVGEFSEWEPTNGATYKAMQQIRPGEWKVVERTLAMTGPEITAQHEQVRHDLVLNRQWLNENKDKAGTKLFEEVKRQTEEIGMLDLSRQYKAAHRFWLDHLLQPIGDKFASTGEITGTRVKQMLNRFQFITKTHADQVEAKARRWSRAAQEASDSAGYASYKEFFADVYDHVIYAIESAPGIENEADVMKLAYKAARKRIPASNTVAANFNEKLAQLLRATKDISEAQLKIAEESGIYIEDKRLKDPLTEKGNLKRHAIKYGWLTNTRRLRTAVIQTLVHDMQAKGWDRGMFDGIKVESMTDEEWVNVVNDFFPPSVVREFVEPFVRKPGKEVFFGATNPSTGYPTRVSQLEAQDAWESSGGNVLAFIDTLFNQTAADPESETGLNEYRLAMLRRFAGLYEMESKIAADASVVKSLYDKDGPKPHRLMDGRTNDLIPPEHFEYDVHDPASARIALAEVAYHAAFGRNGSALDNAITELRSSLDAKARQYSLLPPGSRRTKQAAASARGWNLKELERAYKDRQRIDNWMRELGTYFNGGNQAGAIGDARALLELMQLNMAMVLNQPKSALWNVLSLADFPIVFRGLGKSSLKGTAWALGNLGRNIFGSALEAMGLNIIRAGDYAKEIGEVIEGRQTERLEWGDFISDIGRGGKFQDGFADRVVQGTRWVQQSMRKGVKLGNAKEFAGFNALWAPFRFINEQAASAIATANVQVFEQIIKRAIDYYEANPEALNNPAHRFTAEMLDMKGPAYFSDEGAFEFFKTRAVEYRVGNIEDIARQAAQRKAQGERLLTRDQVLAVAMMAMNEISMESSVNSRPVEMFNNPVLKFGGLLLGWPLAKMNQVHQSLKTADGQREALAVLKGIGVLAAWSLPIGLAYSLLMDEYDEEILNKKSNMRGIDPIAGVPLIGPVLALAGAGKRSGKENLMAMLERSARAGNVYGLGGDAIASMTNWMDPSSGQRDFDLNSRVLVFSQFANLRDSIRNFIHQDGTYTYQSVGRPIIATMGGNSLLQYAQILNNALELDNAEAAVTNRINVNNWLRAAGREAGLEIRAGAGRSSPTPVSVWLREMQVAALSDNRLAFLEAYRAAIAEARREGVEDPEATIRQRWGSRHPLTSVFRTKPDDVEMVRLMAAMDDDGRKVVRDSIRLYESYSEMIEPSPILTQIRSTIKSQMTRATPSAEDIRRRAARQALGY